ncbi:MAG: sensor histidine kinase [Chitinophagaceae bacterium]
MKVLNYTTSYLAVVLLLVLSIWATLFYFAMLDEIYDSIDDGLDNQKGLIIQKASIDSTVLGRQQFDEGDYAIRPIDAVQALQFREQYTDTLMYMQNEKEYEPVRMLTTVFRHGDQYYQMQVITSMVEEDDLITELFYALLWLYAGLLISILLVNNFLLKRIWKPFYHLLQQMQHFRLEKGFNITHKPTKIEEFKLLQQRVEQLLQHNIDTYTSQKHFIENASHELQTPLAIAINKLESLAEMPLQQAELQLVGSALENLQRLTRLNKSLLLLSRIENRQFADEKSVDLNALVKTITQDLEEQLAFYKIQLEVEEKEAVTLHMNTDLAAIMVTNLVKNAIVHNQEGGFIFISISRQALVIENSGDNKMPDTQQLFTRFNSGVSSEASTGLGLAIVKAITDLYRFRIEYAYRQKHVLTIFFY